MKILVAYATSEGQTRKIARWITDKLVDQGATVELVTLKDAGKVEQGRFDGVVLAASIHAGHYQKALTEFAAANAEALNQMATLFLSVSLAAAGHDAKDWRSLENIVTDFQAATGWTPRRTEQIAGAYRPSKYDLLRRLIMRRIIVAKDPDADPDNDKEYTGWSDLDAILQDWLAGLEK